MTGQLRDWFRARTVREQRLLLMMLALLAVTMLWLGVYRPLVGGLSDARARHQDAAVRLGEVRAQAAALRSIGPEAPALGGPLADVVTRAAAEAGFANATVAPQGARRVSLSIPSARSGPVLAWFAGLEARGIVVERVAMRANADPTLTVDVVLVGGR